MTANYAQVNSLTKVILMNVNIQLGALNIGYVLSYLTLTVDTLFAYLNITVEERTQQLSLMNGILPLGCVIGVIIGYFLKKHFTNKHCIYIADFISIFSIFATIDNIRVIAAFRFSLGVANGISSLIMPVYVKSLCPERYYLQISMFLGYRLNTGLAIGQLMGIGYIQYHGATSNWWRVVFLFPAVISIIRSSVIRFIFNYDSPEQLIAGGNEISAQQVIQKIYKEEEREKQFQRYVKMVQDQTKYSSTFVHIFKKRNLIGLQIGIVSMFVQIWCGSFAVFYYSAQIFQELSARDLVMQTVYTICIGLFSVVSQFTTIFMLPKFGSKYILIFGSFFMGVINFAIAILSKYTSSAILFIIFLLLVLLIVVFAATLSPICWSIVPQLNDSDGTFFVMDLRWIFQTILIFTFPYIVRDISIEGAFYIFGSIDFCYMIYTISCIIDNRDKTNQELIAQYHIRYGQFKALPQEQIKL